MSVLVYRGLRVDGGWQKTVCQEWAGRLLPEGST